jgi:hypothetical protein
MLAVNLGFPPIQRPKLTYQKSSSLPRTLAPRLIFFAESTPLDFALSAYVEKKLVRQEFMSINDLLCVISCSFGRLLTFGLKHEFSDWLVYAQIESNMKVLILQRTKQ